MKNKYSIAIAILLLAIFPVSQSHAQQSCQQQVDIREQCFSNVETGNTMCEVGAGIGVGLVIELFLPDELWWADNIGSVFAGMHVEEQCATMTANQVQQCVQQHPVAANCSGTEPESESAESEPAEEESEPAEEMGPPAPGVDGDVAPTDVPNGAAPDTSDLVFPAGAVVFLGDSSEGEGNGNWCGPGTPWICVFDLAPPGGTGDLYDPNQSIGGVGSEP